MPYIKSSYRIHLWLHSPWWWWRTTAKHSTLQFPFIVLKSLTSASNTSDFGKFSLKMPPCIWPWGLKLCVTAECTYPTVTWGLSLRLGCLLKGEVQDCQVFSWSHYSVPQFSLHFSLAMLSYLHLVNCLKIMSWCTWGIYSSQCHYP